MIYENYYYKISEDDLLKLLKIKQKWLQKMADYSPNPIDWEYAKTFNPKEELKEFERFGNEQKVVKIIKE